MGRADDGIIYSADVFECRYGMDLDWQRCHRLNVILLSVIGLWPYGNKLVLQLTRFVGSFFAFCSCFGQLATFLTVNYTTKLVLNNVPLMFVGCAVFFKYISILAVSESIKKITKTINDDFKLLADKDDIRIIKKYFERGKFLTKRFAMLVCSGPIILLLAPLSSVFLDIVIPLNESRNHSFAVMFELFFDQKKHFFLASFLYDGIMIFTALVFVSTEGLFIVYLQHGCALFEVTSRRIRKFMCTTGTSDSKETNNVTVMGEVVQIHSRAISHCRTITEDFGPSYLILLAFGITGLAALLLRSIQALGSCEFTDFFISAICSLAILGYMFYLNFVAQSILNSSVGIFNELYDINWYTLPISTQKLILFCMLYTIKPISMNVHSLYQPSYEGFSQIARMAMSYAATLYSLQ